MKNRASVLFRGRELNSAYQMTLMTKLNSLPRKMHMLVFNQH